MLLFPIRACPSLLHLHQSLIFSNSCRKPKSPFLSPPPPLISSPSNSSKILYSKPNRIKHIKAKKPQNNIQTSELDQEEEEEEEYVDEEEYEEEEGDEEGFSSSNTGFRRRGEERDYDKDPEFGEILGGFIDDPQKAHARVESRLRKKRSKVLHTKTGSGTPMKVRFNKFSFSNSYIWFEFYKAPLPSNISLICDAIRSWHIIGRLGGCNSMNMQLSQAPVDRRPNYDAIQGANVTPTTFYNIGDFEIQENLGRVWVDIGTGETLLLDILVNALMQISSDYVGIKQVVFGGSEFESWNENLTSEDTGCSTHKI